MSAPPDRPATALVIRGIVYSLGGLTSILVARMLGPYERGVWAVALLVSGLVSLSSELGLGMAVFSISRRSRERRLAVVTMAFLLAASSGLLFSGAALLVVLHGLLPLVGAIPRDVLALALGGVVFTNLLAVARQVLLEDGDLAGGVLSQLVQASALFVLLGLMSFVGASTRMAVALLLVSLLVALAFTGARLWRRDLLAPAWDWTLVAPLLRTGCVAHIATIALFLTFRFDLLLVNRFLGPGAAGLYSVSLSLSEILRGLPEVGQTIVLARSSSSDIAKVVRETTRLAVFATAFAGGVAGLFAYWLIPFVFGADYAGAVAPFVALVPGVIGLAISYSISPMLMLQGRIRVSAGVAVVSFLSMLGLDLVIIPRWGLLGAALVSSFVYWLAALLQLRWIKKSQSLVLGPLWPEGADLERLFAARTHPPRLGQK